MPNPLTNYKTSLGTDIGDILVTKEYVMDVFPDLFPAFNDNTLWLWGTNINGQLGDGTNIHRSSPVQTVSGGTTWKQVSCGLFHTAAIKTDNTLWTWGNNQGGQLGQSDLIHRSSPVQVAGTTWKQVSCAASNTAAIKTDGTLWTWGFNGVGQIGDNTVIRRSSPVQIAGTDWKQVVCGEDHALALKIDDTLWGWGLNSNGQIGDNTIINKSSPVQVAGNWAQVSCDFHTAAIKTDGTLWTWGNGGTGRLGLNDTLHRSSPVQIGAGLDWKQVACGSSHTAAIRTDGTLWTWGFGSSGRLGDGTELSKSSPVQTIAGGTNWKQVDCGGTHTVALKTDGTLWGWGAGGSGRLGNDSTTNQSSPVQTITGGTNWKHVACGNSNTAAIKDEAI